MYYVLYAVGGLFTGSFVQAILPEFWPPLTGLVCVLVLLIVSLHIVGSVSSLHDAFPFMAPPKGTRAALLVAIPFGALLSWALGFGTPDQGKL
jgi:hypothetical protein